MCSIVGSFSRMKVIELCKLNEYRGQVAHSISLYSPRTRELYVERYTGPIDYAEVQIPNDLYCIVHMQAPTGNTTADNIHPAQLGDRMLWHNGIIKQHEIERIQRHVVSQDAWDTKLLLESLLYADTDFLDTIDGSFSCLLYDKDLYLFRNEISPMFIDDEMNISSTKFDGAVPTDPNVFLKMNFKDNTIIPGRTFKTAQNPYYFA